MMAIIIIPHICHFWYATIFLGLWKVRQKVRKFATKIAPQQNSVNEYFEILIHIYCKLYQFMAFFAYYFDWDSILGVLFGILGVLFGILGVLFGVLCILFGLLGVFFAVLGVFILWINFPKNSPFRILCGKGTPAWKRYTTAGCGGCDNYEVWGHTTHMAWVPEGLKGRSQGGQKPPTWGPLEF